MLPLLEKSENFIFVGLCRNSDYNFQFFVSLLFIQLEIQTMQLYNTADMNHLLFIVCVMYTMYCLTVFSLFIALFCNVG